MKDELAPEVAARLVALEQTGPEALRSLDKEHSLVIIPFAPVEYHGTHLPFSTDLILAKAFSRGSAERFLADNPHWKVVLYPVIPLGADCVPNQGSIALPHRVIERVARAVGTHFIRYGFANIVLMSGHGGLNHDRALERAARRLNRAHRKKLVRVIAPLGRVMFRLWSEGIGHKVNPLLERKVSPEEEKDFVYELHGGWWETSMVLAHHPERMNDAYRTAPDYLPKARLSIKLLLRLLLKVLPAKQKERLAELHDLVLMGTSWFWGDTSLGYLGFPSRARPEMGAAVTHVAGQEFARLFQKIFVERADVKEAESVYAILDVLCWYGLGVSLLLLAAVVAWILV